MEDIIRSLDMVRSALGTLEITSTRHNLDVVLGSMQILDKTIAQLGSIEKNQASASGKEG